MEQPPAVFTEQKTILVVDDDPEILRAVRAILVKNGHYNILTATAGADALSQSINFKGDIHLLLSDFQMPGMTGVELATMMTVHRPELKVLLMSAFPNGMLVLNEGWHFLAKPFVASQLRALVATLVFPDTPSKFSAHSSPGA